MSIAAIATFAFVVAACSAFNPVASPSTAASRQAGATADANAAATDRSQGQGQDQSASQENSTPTGPSTELLSYFFPVSGAELASVNYIAREASNQAMRRLGDCVSGHGFDLDFESTIPPDLVPRYGSYPAYESLRKYGFNMQRPPGYPPGLAYVEDVQDAVMDGLPLPDGISEGEARALVEIYNDCAIEQEQGATVPPLVLIEATYRDLDLNFDLLLDEIDRSDPRVLKAFESFLTCVAERGWALDLVSDDGSHATTDTPFFGAVDAAVFSETDPTIQRDAELAAAADYADCMQVVEEVRQPLRTDLRAQYVDEHLADMIEMEIQFRNALKELGVGS